ncbi:MAG: hypothetical protein WC428_08045 [Candidatus Paceibacterota bacterium]
MSNFKQRVEEILSFTECEHDGRICSDMTLDKYEERPSCVECQTDRILAVHNAELDRIAEGMQQIRNPYLKTIRSDPGEISSEWRIFDRASKIECKANQAYIQAQKGS